MEQSNNSSPLTPSTPTTKLLKQPLNPQKISSFLHDFNNGQQQQQQQQPKQQQYQVSSAKEEIKPNQQLYFTYMIGSTLYYIILSYFMLFLPSFVFIGTGVKTEELLPSTTELNLLKCIGVLFIMLAIRDFHSINEEHGDCQIRLMRGNILSHATQFVFNLYFHYVYHGTTTRAVQIYGGASACMVTYSLCVYVKLFKR
jgi:hypothetical protein